MIAAKPTQTAAQPAGKLFGPGLVLDIGDKAHRVTAVVAGGGAAVAKIVVGDRIIAVDGVAVAALDLSKLSMKMTGAKGTRVSITLERNGQPVALMVERTTLPPVKKKLSLDFTDMSEVLERKISP